jgi:acetyltransferase
MNDAGLLVKVTIASDRSYRAEPRDHEPMLSENLDGMATTRDGTSIALRSIRAEDEPVLQDLFAHLSPEDVRLRFFTPMRELSRSLADRLPNLDYLREMALVAHHDGAILGAASYFIEPDAKTAEFAVTVRSDWHGRGVGYLLLTRLMEVARHAGLDELSGLVLRENKPMLDMCRDLGFAIAQEPNDTTVLRVRKLLAAADEGHPSGCSP